MSGPPAILVFGVSGAGKTTIGRMLAERLGWAFLDADDLHPKANVEKMRSGAALDDADRWPWLDAVGRWIDAQAAEGRASVIACSALKRAYRARLRAGRPALRAVYLAGSEALIADRLEHRTGHYWPASLLPTQFAALEPPGRDEHAIVVDIGPPADVLVEAIARRVA
ncbi:MAG TPA: gluconokinase [Caulobacteraceae bacterium]|nr:gluconokinase [Caulobacteraceae bacterium]